MEERLEVLTADAVSFTLEPAGLGTRIIAALIDTGVQTVVLFALWLTGAISFGLDTTWTWAQAGLGILAFLVYFAYYPFFEAIWSGQTPGKRIKNLRVVKVTGHPIGAIEAMLRGVVRLIDVHVFAIGFALAFATKRSQRLGDLLAQTIVIREQPVALPKPSAEPAFTLSAKEVETVRLWRNRITPEELALVRRFLERRHHLDSDQREKIAVRLAQLAYKVDLPPRLPWDAEAFLEDLVRICLE